MECDTQVIKNSINTSCTVFKFHLKINFNGVIIIHIEVGTNTIKSFEIFHVFYNSENKQECPFCAYMKVS